MDREYYPYSVAPAATHPTQLLNRIAWWTDVANGTSAPIVPAMSPPQNIMIAPTNGTGGFYDDQMGISASPTVSWSAGGLGVPSLYQLTIFQLTNVGGRTRSRLVATLFTPNTSITLPNLLTTGNAYVISLAALSGPSINTPFLGTATTAIAVVSSGVLQP